MKKKVLIGLVALMMGGSMAAPSSITGLGFLEALASLRNVPIYDQLKAFVARYSDAEAVVIAIKLKSPVCAVEKAGKAGNKVLSVGDINIIALETRLGRCSNPSSVTGLQFLAALASLRNVPIYDQLKAFVARYSDAEAAIIAIKLKSPVCAVEKAGKAGTKVLSVGDINIIALEARLGRCLSVSESKSVFDFVDSNAEASTTLAEVFAVLVGLPTNPLVIDALKGLTARTPNN